MTFKPLELQDCQNIAKAFERGSAYCATEESVFAMMTPLLTGMRAQSAALLDQMETADTLSISKSATEKGREKGIGSSGSSPLGDETSSGNMNNMDKATEDDEGFVSEVIGNFYPGAAREDQYPTTAPGEGIVPGLPANIAGGIFNSECIPCGDRLNMLGELDAAYWLDRGAELLEHWLQWLQWQLAQLGSLIKLFTNVDQYVDLCAMFRWLNDFVCIPDLQRILSVLMALLSRVSFDLGGIFDIILGLIGPLVGPILSGFVDLLEKYILLIVKPIECIIDSIQDIIRKLDYNVLFRNIDSLDKHIGLGPREGSVTGKVKIPFIDIELEMHSGPDRLVEAEFNMFGPAGRAIQRENAQNEAAVGIAAEELRAIRSASARVDSSDSDAVAKYKSQKKQAEKKYKDALEKKSLSELGRANLRISETTAGFKSSLFTLIGYLRDAVETITKFFQSIFDELKKIQGEYIGGGNTLIEQLTKKIGLVQMIAFVTAVIQAYANHLDCGDDEHDLKIENLVPEQQGMHVWTDEKGAIHIEESSDEINAAIEAVVSATGVTPENTESGAEAEQEKDSGDQPSSTTARQKLQSLIEFTGDPVLDSQIARTASALTTPVDVAFKCPLQTTTAQAEQVNKWIQELKSE